MKGDGGGDVVWKIIIFLYLEKIETIFPIKPTTKRKVLENLGWWIFVEEILILIHPRKRRYIFMWLLKEKWFVKITICNLLLWANWGWVSREEKTLWERQEGIRGGMRPVLRVSTRDQRWTEWILMSTQNSYVEILPLNVMILGGGAFGRY